MSAFKRLHKSDVFVVPYIANKSWSFTFSKMVIQQGVILFYMKVKNTLVHLI
jgi:hypothetical protein